MIAPTPKSDQPLDAGLPAGAVEPSKKLVNPNLTGSLVADYDALQNDLRQAQELAADFQRQLAGKSNDHAQLKQILEKTLADLAHLQTGIVELRTERHNLANEAMRAAAYQAKLGTVTGERDRLRVELEVVRVALQRSANETTMTIRDRDRRIAELAIEVVMLKQELEDAREALKAARAVPVPATGV